MCGVLMNVVAAALRGSSAGGGVRLVRLNFPTKQPAVVAAWDALWTMQSVRSPIPNCAEGKSSDTIMINMPWKF
jgi:hypothetical protein